MGFHLDRRAAELAERVANLPDETLLTRTETAAWLGVHERTLMRYGLPEIRFNKRRVRFRKGAVVEWLREREQQRRSAS